MNYIITYTINSGESKKMRIKNCSNEFEVRAKMGGYVKRKYGSVNLIIHKCEEDIFNLFKDIFG